MIMNKIILVIALAGTFFASCQSGEKKKEEDTSEMVDPKNPPIMTFEHSSHDFGTISQGEKVKHSFYFTNTGKSPLLIHSAQGTCGCTIPEWPKEPIQPGEEGKIEVSFNSEYKTGHQEKMVTILANTKPTKTVIKITGDVLVPDKKSK
jgi:hypothetical protein